MSRIGVLISGSGSNLQAILDACVTDKISGQVVLVLSNKEDAFGLQRAEKHNIAAYHARNTEEIKEYLLEYEVEYLVLAGYIRKIPEEIIRLFPNKIINVHPSLLPSFAGKGFYGIKVHQAAIKRGVKYTGVTVHLVNEGLDEGPILEQEVVPVLAGETASELQKRVLKVEHRLLPMSVEKLLKGEY